jgi:hypothetical protein
MPYLRGMADHTTTSASVARSRIRPPKPSFSLLMPPCPAATSGCGKRLLDHVAATSPPLTRFNPWPWRSLQAFTRLARWRRPAAKMVNQICIV